MQLMASMVSHHGTTQTVQATEEPLCICLSGSGLTSQLNARDFSGQEVTVEYRYRPQPVLQSVKERIISVLFPVLSNVKFDIVILIVICAWLEKVVEICIYYWLSFCPFHLTNIWIWASSWPYSAWTTILTLSCYRQNQLTKFCFKLATAPLVQYV